MPGSQILNGLEKDSCAVSFIHLELRRDYKAGYMKVGESKVSIRLQDTCRGCMLS